MLDFDSARHNMIESQIRPNDVTDKAVLAAIMQTPREKFVPAAKRSVAYQDEDLLIHTCEDGTKRHLMEPRVFARLLQMADIGSHALVLYVGAGLGYGPAVVSKLAETVVALESDPTLAAAAGQNLSDTSADNVAVIEGALENGCPEQAPFDAIIIEGSVPEVPAALQDQLKDGGRLLCVIGHGLAGKAHVFERAGGQSSARAEFSAAVAPVPGFEKPQGFVF